MWWAAAIQGGLALFGALGQKDSGREAKRLAKHNVASSKAETAETLRRHEAQGAQQEGYTRAVAGASGFSVQEGTSQQNWINEMVAENKRQRAFISESGKREEERLKLGGEYAASQADAGALGSLGSAVGSFGEAYSMWSTN